MCTSDFQSEVGEVFGEIGGELPAKFGRRFSSFFCRENRQKHFPPKLHRQFHHQTSLRGSGLWRALLRMCTRHWRRGWQTRLRTPSLKVLEPQLPKGPRRTKNTARSKFTTRSIFSTAGWFTIAAHLVRTPFPWELQTFFPSKKGPRRTKFGGRSKNTTA